MGKIRDNFELWEAEKMSFEDLLKKVKEQSRAKKLDRDAHRGKTGVATGAHINNESAWTERWTDGGAESYDRPIRGNPQCQSGRQKGQ